MRASEVGEQIEGGRGEKEERQRIEKRGSKNASATSNSSRRADPSRAEGVGERPPTPSTPSAPSTSPSSTAPLAPRAPVAALAPVAASLAALATGAELALEGLLVAVVEDLGLLREALSELLNAGELDAVEDNDAVDLVERRREDTIVDHLGHDRGDSPDGEGERRGKELEREGSVEGGEGDEVGSESLLLNLPVKAGEGRGKAVSDRI